MNINSNVKIHYLPEKERARERGESILLYHLSGPDTLKIETVAAQNQAEKWANDLKG